MSILEQEDAAIALFEAEGKKAFKAFKKLLESDQNNVTAHFYLAVIQMRRKEYDKALYHAREVIKINPHEENIYLNLGVIYKTMGNSRKAIELYKKELAQTPDCKDAFYNLGNTYSERHQWKKAAKYWEEAFRLQHRVDDFIVELAHCYRMTRRLTEEINLYRNYLKLYPNDGWALENLGAALIDASEYKEALHYLTEAQKGFPPEPTIERNIDLANKAIQKGR